ncbi:hypothetical protein PSTG_02493 [Puccinia striiformis f. sp. tritici PST-78]|uniref:Uncharacterized protein n=1 Tax=Puccinia striiformis f. sp. tritici PST-78 TaxID=1165861 RepID=A0A0L0VZF7_9BASI|nr:hypothetical protein PSTG_02493 [Puccinia striiformis f. sp. tritici PST-78]
MDSSSLLQLHAQRVNTSNEDLKLSVGQGIDFLECDRFNSTIECHDDQSRNESSCEPDQPTKIHELKLSIPMPNFLIDPQDGQFTPYFERSPVSTPDQEFDEPMFFSGGHRSRDSSPDSVLSPLRSRATSIALKKLMETQAQMLLDISAAWKKKYPVDFCHDTRSTAADNNDDHERVPIVQREQQQQHAIQPLQSSTTITIPGLLPANSILPSSSLPKPRKNRSMSHKSSAGSLASFVDRLSLREADKNSLVVDVESWKREAVKSKLKQESTRSWIDQLPSNTEFEDPSSSSSPVS